MGGARHVASVAIDRSEERIGGHSGGPRTEVPEVQRSSRAPRRHSKRWLWCIRGGHSTRIVSLAKNCCKSNGCYCEITRMRLTSRRRSISLHPSKNGRYSQIVENFQNGVPRHLSHSWRGFTKFTLLNEKHPRGFLWSGERLTKIQTTTRLDHLWPEIWSGMSNAAQKSRRRNGLLKSQSSIMPENWQEFISSIPKMESFRKPLKKSQGENWRYRWRQQCLAKWDQRSAQMGCRKLQAIKKTPTKSKR